METGQVMFYQQRQFYLMGVGLFLKTPFLFALMLPGEAFHVCSVPECHGLGIFHRGLPGVLHPKHRFYWSKPLAE